MIGAIETEMPIEVFIFIQRSNSSMRWIGSGSAQAFSRSPSA